MVSLKLYPKNSTYVYISFTQKIIVATKTVETKT